MERSRKKNHDVMHDVMQHNYVLIKKQSNLSANCKRKSDFATVYVLHMHVHVGKGHSLNTDL